VNEFTISSSDLQQDINRIEIVLLSYQTQTSSGPGSSGMPVTDGAPGGSESPVGNGSEVGQSESGSGLTD
jgi:hypothetical protein